MNSLKEEIFAYVKGHYNTTFAELQNNLPGFTDPSRSDMLFLIGDTNLAMWQGLSTEAFKALNELRGAKQIEYDPVHPVHYAADGWALQLPLAKRPMKYKEPHWLPTAINLHPSTYT
jgi:hypothetical protein